MQMTEDELSIIASEMSICNLPETAMQKSVYNKGALIKN